MVKKSKFFKSLVVIYSLIAIILLSFSTYALIINKDNFDGSLGGLFRVAKKGDKPLPPSGRQTIIIDKNSTNVVIQSGYNYVFKGDDDWGTQESPIDLNSFDIIKGTQDQPLDAYIDGGNNYFKLVLVTEELPNGLLGVFSGALVDLTLYAGSISNNAEVAIFASTLTQDGVIYNCTNYLNINSYSNEGFSAGFVKFLDGRIAKSKNYGDIVSSGYASGFAYSVTGSIEDCTNYGEMESTSMQSAGIAIEVSGQIKNCQNKATIKGNAGVAGIAFKVNGGALIDCVNGELVTDIEIYASTGDSAGVVYIVDSVEIDGEIKKGYIENCVNYANIASHGSYGIAYSVNGDIIGSKNYGNMLSYNISAGIVCFLEGSLIRSENYGEINARNNCASGLAHKAVGNIFNSHNYGAVITEVGDASGIVYEMEGNIESSTNNGLVHKTGWGAENVAGIAAIAKGQIISCKNEGQIIVDNKVELVGGIAAIMQGKIIGSQSNGTIIHNNQYESITVGGITADLSDYEADSETITALIQDCEFAGGFEFKSDQAYAHYIAYSYPAGSITNCIGMGEIYNL